MRQDQGTGQTSRSAPSPKEGPITLTKTHKVLIGVVTGGAVVIAGIGFSGSYAAVRKLAAAKGFGDFAYAFPIGIDAGICVLLALDLLLTWIRIPFPLLRQAAWLLTAATIAFNGAAAWPDPLGVGMHAVIPVLFVVAVEAARHAIGRIADITADRHMEGVRISRWLLAPLPTFLLWRRMKLWELRSYDTTIKLEQQRLVYEARLRAKFGRGWRRKAPVESMMPLRLAKYGVPLTETAPAGLEAAGIDLPVELERLDEAVTSKATEPTRELEAVHLDLDEHQRTDAEAYVQDVTPEPQYNEPAPRRNEYATAARNDGAPHVVQARIEEDAPDVHTPTWADVPHDDFEVSPIGDSDEPEPVPESKPEPELHGVELLEHLYLQLPQEERSKSANALAQTLAPLSEFTEGTTRKYLAPIIKKHSKKSTD